MFSFFRIRTVPCNLHRATVLRDKSLKELSLAKKDLEIATSSKDSYLRVIYDEMKEVREIQAKLQRVSVAEVDARREEVRQQMLMHSTMLLKVI